MMLHITFPWIDTPSSTDIKPLILLFEECRSLSAHTWSGEHSPPSTLSWKWMSTLPNTQPLFCGDSAWPTSWKDVDLILLVSTPEFPGMKEFSWAKKVSKRPPGTCKSLSNPMSSTGFPLSATQEALEAPVHVGQLGPGRCHAGREKIRQQRKGWWAAEWEVRQDIAKLLLAIGCGNIWKKSKKIINWFWNLNQITNWIGFRNHCFKFSSPKHWRGFQPPTIFCQLHQEDPVMPAINEVPCVLGSSSTKPCTELSTSPGGPSAAKFEAKLCPRGRKQLHRDFISSWSALTNILPRLGTVQHG